MLFSRKTVVMVYDCRLQPPMPIETMNLTEVVFDENLRPAETFCSRFVYKKRPSPVPNFDIRLSSARTVRLSRNLYADRIR